LLVEVDPFQIGDLVKHTYYDWDGSQTTVWDASDAACRNIGFIIDIIEDPDEKQVDLFPKVLVYDARLQRSVLTHTYNLEFISRG
tara:strand:+ start:119 stop:373 length:255 start_codon:yes stop_codon:yes gene_type:complete